MDTAACASATDRQLFKKVYGQFPPKISDSSLSAVQTGSGVAVPLLGMISILIHLNGREHSFEFHVMQTLAYDATLGRNFLQKNGVIIDPVTILCPSNEDDILKNKLPLL